MANRCSFCKKTNSRVVMARICSSCAKGRPADAWCDFCGKTPQTDFAWICPECAKGQTGDQWCDFCGKTTRTAFARICRSCSA